MSKQKNININLKEVDEYLKAGISIDCVIFGFDENELKVLLMRCDMEPYKGMWSLIGDLVELGENLDDAAVRVLKERGSLEEVFMEQVRTFGNVDRHPSGRVISVAYYSLVKISDYNLTSTSNNREAHWHSISEIEELAFDHNRILEVCLGTLRKQVREEPVGFNLLPEKFTMSQLQNLYETILGVDLDKRNFRKKILKMKLLINLNEYQQNVAHRPARLYNFDQKRYEQLRHNGLIFDL